MANHIRIILSFLLLFLAKSLFAQKQQTGEIIYDYKLNLNGIELPRKAHLTFSDKEVLFYHSRGEGFVMIDLYGNVGDHTLKVTTVNDNSGRQAIDGYYQDEEGNTCYFDYENNRLIVRDLVFFEPYIYEEDIPKINWSIQNEKKTINDLNCIKAEATFRGRKYTAWFTPDIPLPYGPWKLQGLPGLILEVEDEEKQVSFSVSKISIPIEGAELSKITPPKNGKQISFEDAKTIWTDIQKKMISRMNSTQDRDSDPMQIAKLNLLEQFENEH